MARQALREVVAQKNKVRGGIDLELGDLADDVTYVSPVWLMGGWKKAKSSRLAITTLKYGIAPVTPPGTLSSSITRTKSS